MTVLLTVEVCGAEELVRGEFVRHGANDMAIILGII